MTEPALLNILIVEDEALVAMLIEDALTLHGHRVVGIADTLAAAMALAEGDRPDLALCDVRLAHGDSGVAIAQALAARDIPCVFLSGNCPDAVSDPRIIGCVAKPFHTAGLGMAVDAAYRVARGDTPERLPPELVLY